MFTTTAVATMARLRAQMELWQQKANELVAEIDLVEEYGEYGELTELWKEMSEAEYQRDQLAAALEEESRHPGMPGLVFYL